LNLQNKYDNVQNINKSTNKNESDSNQFNLIHHHFEISNNNKKNPLNANTVYLDHIQVDFNVFKLSFSLNLKEGQEKATNKNNFVIESNSSHITNSSGNNSKKKQQNEQNSFIPNNKEPANNNNYYNPYRNMPYNQNPNQFFGNFRNEENNEASNVPQYYPNYPYDYRSYNPYEFFQYLYFFNQQAAQGNYSPYQNNDMFYQYGANNLYKK